MKTINQEAINFLNGLRAKAKTKEINVTDAVTLLITKMPDISRAECYNSAAEAGINALTARNIWDRKHKAAEAVRIEEEAQARADKRAAKKATKVVATTKAKKATT